MNAVIVRESDWLAITPQLPLRELRRLRSFDVAEIAVRSRSLLSRVMISTDRLGNIAELVVGNSHPVRKFDLRSPRRLELLAFDAAPDAPAERKPACLHSFRQTITSLFQSGRISN